MSREMNSEGRRGLGLMKPTAPRSGCGAHNLPEIRNRGGVSAPGSFIYRPFFNYLQAGLRVRAVPTWQPDLPQSRGIFAKSVVRGTHPTATSLSGVRAFARPPFGGLGQGVEFFKGCHQIARRFRHRPALGPGVSAQHLERLLAIEAIALHQ